MRPTVPEIESTRPPHRARSRERRRRRAGAGLAALAPGAGAALLATYGPSVAEAQSRRGCPRCHTPGFGHEGGFPTGGAQLHGVGCGSCHDDANDPGFEFAVEDKIALIRHGFRDREPPRAAAE